MVVLDRSSDAMGGFGTPDYPKRRNTSLHQGKFCMVAIHAGIDGSEIILMIMRHHDEQR